MAGEPPQTQSWWQTLPGILTAVAAIITAATGLIVALNQAGLFSRVENTVSSSPTPTGALSADTPAKPPTGVDELEQRLKAVNINLSTGEDKDRNRVRGYFTGPTSAYHLLAVSCLQIMGNQRLKNVGHLDMIDKYYTLLVGEGNYVSAEGKLNLGRVKEAMVKAQNVIHGVDATSFEQIVESR